MDFSQAVREAKENPFFDRSNASLYRTRGHDCRFVGDRMNNTNAVKPVRHGDQIELEITTLAFGGDSVGRYQDFAIFVPGGLPGERVKPVLPRSRTITPQQKFYPY